MADEQTIKAISDAIKKLPPFASGAVVDADKLSAVLCLAIKVYLEETGRKNG